MTGLEEPSVGVESNVRGVWSENAVFPLTDVPLIVANAVVSANAPTSDALNETAPVLVLTEVTGNDMFAVSTAVKCPCASYCILGTTVELPTYVVPLAVMELECLNVEGVVVVSSVSPAPA